MRLTVLGACGAWPEAGQACSGYLVEHDGFRLLVDLGYATVPRLLERVTADQVDAVFISHGHPDHCADLNPLLRARALRDDPPAPLPVYSLPGALDAVLALDRPGMLADAYVLHEFTAGSRFDIGPFRAQTRLLPHSVPNAGVRLAAGDRVFAYTGDTGPSPEVVELARVAGRLAVKRVVCAVDPGLVVNPNTLKAQIEGGIGFALTNTLKSRITFSNGGADQSNFFDYPLLRIDEMPEIVPIVLASDRPPQGFGEVVLAPVAPAVAQALLHATGRRLDVMPFPDAAFRSNA